MKYIFAALLLLFFFTFPTSVEALSCADPPELQVAFENSFAYKYNNNDHIFIGEILELDSEEGNVWFGPSYLATINFPRPYGRGFCHFKLSVCLASQE